MASLEISASSQRLVGPDIQSKTIHNVSRQSIVDSDLGKLVRSNTGNNIGTRRFGIIATVQLLTIELVPHVISAISLGPKKIQQKSQSNAVGASAVVLESAVCNLIYLQQTIFIFCIIIIITITILRIGRKVRGQRDQQHHALVVWL